MIVNSVNDNLLVHQCDTINLWSSEFINISTHTDTYRIAGILCKA